VGTKATFFKMGGTRIKGKKKVYNFFFFFFFFFSGFGGGDHGPSQSSPPRSVTGSRGGQTTPLGPLENFLDKTYI
jgi:hypothetical protein